MPKKIEYRIWYRRTTSMVEKEHFPEVELVGRDSFVDYAKRLYDNDRTYRLVRVETKDGKTVKDWFGNGR